MLLSVRLTNFAVMEEVEVAFGEGLTVVTGETGAGKSMLIDALGLLLGGRAEADVVRSGAEEAVIEGIFECTPALRERLVAAGLEPLGSEVCVRRTIGRQGRGKVHVDGSLVTVGVLQRLMRGLVDLAGQHEHLAMLEPGRHLQLLDAFPVSEPSPLPQFKEAWAALAKLDAELEALGGDEAQVATRADFLRFQLEEIERVNPEPKEDETLDAERRRLASSQRLRHGASAAEQLVSTGEGSALELLGRALQQVSEGERLDPALGKARSALVTAQSEMEEAARTLSRYLSGLDSDPERLAEVEDRLDQLKRLCRKHACTLDALLAKRDALKAQLTELGGRSERRAELASQREAAFERAQGLAASLTRARLAQAEALTAAVRKGLSQLAMPHAQFLVALESRALGPSGGDEVHFQFSANKGEPPKPLAKVASGGEASRLMLALRAALAGTDGVATVVFDEADAGVGGAEADVVGRLIRGVAARCQVLCITHLPQVAVHAEAHLRLEKHESKGRARSQVRVLDASARTEELARMLSGLEVTQEAIAAAEALYRSARRQPPGRRRVAAAPM